MNVILTSQHLFCTYQDVFDKSNAADKGDAEQHFIDHQRLGGQWNLIIKIAGVRKKRVQRSAYSYTAQNIQGATVFKGCTSSAAGSAYGALLEALMEAAVQARIHGFNQILVLSSSKRLVQLFNMNCNPSGKKKLCLKISYP